MENVIYNEMRMRGWLVDVGNVYHRVRNTEGKQQRVTLEVDLSATRERADLHPVGVAYARCRKDGTGETVVASCR